MTTQISEHGRVRIQEGVFRNFTGTVEKVYAERRKLMVSLTLFGRTVEIEMPFEHVQAIE